MPGSHTAEAIAELAGNYLDSPQYGPLHSEFAILRILLYAWFVLTTTPAVCLLTAWAIVLDLLRLLPYEVRQWIQACHLG